MDAGLLDKIVAFALADEEIRAVILEGSLATGAQVDELSDYDVNIYARNSEHYLSDDHWMTHFGEVLLYQKEVFQFYAASIPTRLILFRHGKRIDFSFWQLDLLTEMVRGSKEYESYKNCYKILVDKDRLAEQLKPASGAGFLVLPPDRDEFLQTLYDFWFEAYCVARYLSRRDLWYAKLIENRYIKDHLYRMALWNRQAAHAWGADPLLHLEGKRFEKWAEAELIQAVSGCFSGYDVEATWSSLFAMLALFNRLARQTAGWLQIEYPQRVERDILDYLYILQGR